MFEFGLAHPSADPGQRAKAVTLAATAFGETGWREPEAIECPLPGRCGSVEHLLHRHRRPEAVTNHDR